MSLTPASRLGPYEIVDLLGRGGMGEVYRARDPRLGREVAVKVLPEAIEDPDRLRRFETEARATGGLNHPNILTIYDVGTELERPYLVAELLEGESLRDRLKSSALPTEVAVAYSLQIARGLAAAHERGVIHRDLKPDNLFLTVHDTVKILDFGLAKLVSQQVPMDSLAETAPLPTGTGLVLGTPGYLSPEQARGRVADERSDLFSLGTVLYEMLSGRRAFAAETSSDALAALLTKEPPSLSELGLEVPLSLEALIRRCLAKNPEERIASARELVEELERIQASTEPLPLAATPGRHSPLLLGTAMGVIMLVLLVFWGLGRMAREQPEASPEIRAVAVLPLANLSGDPGQEYFADGMTEALIAELSQLGAFKVISRTSVMRYKETTKALPEIAAELGVDAVVEGSVMRSGGRVRITVQLIEAATDHHLWAQTFEREPEDVLALQSEVTREMVRGLGLHLGAEARPSGSRKVDPEAYDAFLRAQTQYLGQNEPEPVIAGFERAIALDPDFAPAYATLADFLSYQAMVGRITPGDAYLRARQLASRAVELDPELALARAVMARVHVQYEWNWSDAQSQFERALELNPDDPFTLSLWGFFRVAILGDCDGGLSVLEKARDLDPFNPMMHFDLGVYNFHCRRLDDSIRDMERVNELEPEFEFARLVLAWNYCLKGWSERAARQCDLQVETLGARFDANVLASCAWVNGQIGRVDVAAHLSERLFEEGAGSPVDPAFFAFAAMAVGDDDAALGFLEEALRQRSSNLVFIRTGPIYDPLREAPRFLEIWRQMELPP